MSNKLKQRNLIFILLIFLGLNNNIFAQQGWYNLNVSFGGYGIYFKDINTGIVAGYKTTNAGLTWNYTGIVGYLSFPTPNTGYLATIGGSLYKTTNFGDNWIAQYNPSGSLYSINFPDVNTGFACGSGGLIKTTNGGNNWFTVTTPVPPFNYLFTNVFFTDLFTGYIVGFRYGSDTSVFLKTTNSGINWTSQFYPINNWGRFYSIFFINANTGVVSSVGSVGYILKTTNGGTGWNQIIVPSANNINSLYFPSASTGYGACWGGQILKTSNGGNNWFLQTTGTGSILNSIFFINNLTGYVSGDDNTVLKTTNGGGPPIGITPISNEVPKGFSLGQNYPNPFNPKTIINFQLPMFNYVSLKIFDVLGREVATLVNEQLKPGTYEVEWDGSGFASGVYYYKIITGDLTQTRKMVLLK